MRNVLASVPLSVWIVGGAALYLYLQRKRIARALDPTSSENVVYSGITRLIDDPHGGTLGTKFYDWLHEK